MPLSVGSSTKAALAYLSIEFDGKYVAGVTVVADFCPLFKMVDVHALWHRNAHDNYQTAGEKTLHDVNIRSFCWGQSKAGDQYQVSMPTWMLEMKNLILLDQIFLLSYTQFHSFIHLVHTARDDAWQNKNRTLRECRTTGMDK